MTFAQVEEVMERVRSVALDTARGRTLELVKRLLRFPEGQETPAAAASPDYSEESERKLLYFLRSIKALKYVAPQQESEYAKPKRRWIVSPRLRSLYEEITHAEEKS